MTSVPSPRRADTRRPAVAYVRASTAKQDLSCDDQVAAIESYCQRVGLALMRVFRDDGVSGTRGRGQRAAWDELLEYLTAGAMTGGAVVVWSMDRWSRDFRAGLVAAWAVGDLQVELHTTDSGKVDLDSTEGQIMGAMRLAVAAQESRERSRRVRERKRAHLEAGYWVTRPPYGYRLEGTHGRKRLVPDEVEAGVVRKMFELFDSGVGYGPIARHLADHGITTRHGNDWCVPSIKRVLSGWSYGGFWRSRKTGKIEPVMCEVFLPRDLWQRCREIAEQKTGEKRPGRRRWPLSGLIICEECTRRMRIHTWTTRDGGRRRCYRCPGRQLGRCGNDRLLRLETLEAAVMGWWRAIASGDGLPALAREVVAQEHAEALAAAMRRWPIEEELRDVEAQEVRLVDAIRVVGLDDVIQRELDMLRSRRRVLEERIGECGEVILPLDVGVIARELEREMAAVDSPLSLRDWIDEILVTTDGEVVISGLGRQAVLDV